MPTCTYMLYMYIHACVHVQRHLLLGTIPENYGMTFDLWNIIVRQHCVYSGASASVVDREYMHVYICIYVCVHV